MKRNLHRKTKTAAGPINIYSLSETPVHPWMCFNAMLAKICP